MTLKMTPKDLISQLEAAGTLPPKTAAGPATKLLQAAFASIEQQIDALPAGERLRIQKLGTFTKRELENKDGETVSRIHFKPTPAPSAG